MLDAETDIGRIKGCVGHENDCFLEVKYGYKDNNLLLMMMDVMLSFLRA